MGTIKIWGTRENTSQLAQNNWWGQSRWIHPELWGTPYASWEFNIYCRI